MVKLEWENGIDILLGLLLEELHNFIGLLMRTLIFKIVLLGGKGKVLFLYHYRHRRAILHLIFVSRMMGIVLDLLVTTGS